ncbi:MAG: Heat-inducible transcription repressor HrcA [Chlamydiae bacterium]|nr:Heat-inducible transcription repressor HrcA [Chlamydiota bacterium]
MKQISKGKASKSKKNEREYKVLIGLIEHFLQSGKPVGSNALKEAGFADLSSATIRNYFFLLEKEGYLKQLHTSGGRVPTQKAYQYYAKEFIDSTVISPQEEEILATLRKNETKEIALYLQQCAETLTSLTNYAVFLSAPRFDHDFIIDLKLVPVDYHRFLCVIITDFGVIQTELLHADNKLSSFSIKRIEEYFHWRLTGRDKPENLSEAEEQLAQKFYNELMVRYIVGYSNFIDEEIYRTGFSKLLTYPDFHDTTVLANSLALFENAHSMRLLLRDCSAHGTLKFWIGDDLAPYATGKPNCSVLSIPYKINKQIVGAIGILGPTRMPYKQLFGLLRAFVDSVSETLTRNIYKFKINYRQPQPGTPYIQKEEHHLIGQSRLMLLEDKTK